VHVVGHYHDSMKNEHLSVPLPAMIDDQTAPFIRKSTRKGLAEGYELRAIKLLNVRQPPTIVVGVEFGRNHDVERLRFAKLKL